MYRRTNLEIQQKKTSVSRFFGSLWGLQPLVMRAPSQIGQPTFGRVISGPSKTLGSFLIKDTAREWLSAESFPNSEQTQIPWQRYGDLWLCIQHWHGTIQKWGSNPGKVWCSSIKTVKNWPVHLPFTSLTHWFWMKLRKSSHPLHLLEGWRRIKGLTPEEPLLPG